MGIDDDRASAQPTPEELRLGERIANLAQDPIDEARARIMAAVRSAPGPATTRRPRMAMGRRLRLALVGFGATGLLLSASAGALAASSDALPNSPAYGLRRFQESLRVAVASQRQQPRLRLQFAAEKLQQAKAQAGRGDVSDAAKLLSDCKQDLGDAHAELQDIHDPPEALDLAGEEARLQADAVNEQGQVNNIVNGSPAVVPSRPGPPPGDAQNQGPEGNSLPPANSALRRTATTRAPRTRRPHRRSKVRGSGRTPPRRPCGGVTGCTQPQPWPGSPVT